MTVCSVCGEPVKEEGVTVRYRGQVRETHRSCFVDVELA